MLILLSAKKMKRKQKKTTKSPTILSEFLPSLTYIFAFSGLIQ